MSTPPAIAILGASGLIGHALVRDLTARGYRVVPVARRFTAAQRALHQSEALVAGVVDLPVAELAALIERTGADVVINCIGVLQDGPGGTTQDVHAGFAARLLAALGPARHRLLVHLSIPAFGADSTGFARSKRAADALIAASGQSCAILRPGFIIADTAYGGSALLRALAMWPFDLPASLATRPLAVTSAADLASGIARLIDGWRQSGAAPDTALDVFSDDTTTVGDVLAAFRRQLGGPRPWFSLSAVLLRIGTILGDAAALLGWRPPIRSTALIELQRGVSGDARGWRTATSLPPQPLATILAASPSGVAERWFARLYLLKALIVVGLAKFWIVSGLIALLPSFAAAVDLLVQRGTPAAFATALTFVSCLLDISTGLAIAVRRSHRVGLAFGICLSLGYILGAAVLTPDLWLEPLGALVKTGPAIVLMLVALAISDDR